MRVNTVTKMVVDGRTIELYDYYELCDYEKDAVLIQAKIHLMSDQIEEFLQFLEEHTSTLLYFPVLLGSEDDKVLTMRFATCHWSKQDDEIKFLLRLVEKSYDENDEGDVRLTQFDETAAQKGMIFETAELVEGILMLLKAKGVLTETEEADLRTEAKKREFRREIDLHQRQDIDIAFDFDKQREEEQ